jgi:hypothetical protein
MHLSVRPKIPERLLCADTRCPVHSPAFPRAETMKSLTSVIASQPQHAKAAAAALADIGEAMYKSTMVEETELLINSTLSQDVNVRRACLQALQV